jgi:hypothetical protein
MGSFTRLHARQCEKPAVITHCLPQFHSTPCRSSSSSQHSDRLEPLSSCWEGALWRPCNFIPLYSLTGSVGQLFASHLGGQQFTSFTSWGCTNSQWNWVSPVSVVSLQCLIFCLWSPQSFEILVTELLQHLRRSSALNAHSHQTFENLRGWEIKLWFSLGLVWLGKNSRRLWIISCVYENAHYVIMLILPESGSANINKVY